MPEPYYQDHLSTLYHGDARELCRDIVIPASAVVITDPVWPNALPSLAGSDAPLDLFADVMATLCERGLQRAIVILGLDSDPRFLSAVPATLRFRRVTWLRYARPSYKGPLLVAADVAYVFGEFGMAFKGQRVWPGEIVATTSRAKDLEPSNHPCPRRPEHMAGIIRGYTRQEDVILDPFAGSGTTACQASRARRQSIGVEIEEHFCADQVRRLMHASAQVELDVE